MLSSANSYPQLVHVILSLQVIQLDMSIPQGLQVPPSGTYPLEHKVQVVVLVHSRQWLMNAEQCEHVERELRAKPILQTVQVNRSEQSTQLLIKTMHFKQLLVAENV